MSVRLKRLISLVLIFSIILSVTTVTVFAATNNGISIQKKEESITSGTKGGTVTKTTTWQVNLPNRNYFPNMSVSTVIVDTQTNAQIFPSSNVAGGVLVKDLHNCNTIKIISTYSVTLDVTQPDGSVRKVTESLGKIESSTYDISKYKHEGTVSGGIGAFKKYDIVNVPIYMDTTKQTATDISRKYNIQINTDFDETPTGSNAGKKGPNIAERYFAEMLVSIADYIFNPIMNYGADIDTLIYNGEGSRFKLDFFIAKDIDLTNPLINPFAKVGYIGFQITKSLALAFMVTVLSILFFRMQLNVITKTKLDFKEAMNNFLISFFLIMLAPQIINFVTFMVNYIVSLLSPASATGSTYLETLRAAATNKDNASILGDAALYLSTVVINFYFMIVYATRAVHVTLFYMLTPITSLYLNSKKMRPTYENFVSDFFQTISIQFIDALLFLILTLVFVYIPGSDGGLIRFIMSCSIIPLRGVAKKYLGIGGSTMASDMLGFAGIMGAASLIRGVAGGGKNLISGVSDGFYNMRRGREGLDTMNRYGMSDFTQQQGAMSGGMYSDESVPAQMGSNMEMPDITPYMNTSSHMAGPMSANMTPANAMRQYEMKSRYEDMIRGGRMSIMRNVGSAAGGATLGTIGAIAGSGLGLTGAVYGAQIAGSIGSGIGYYYGNKLGSRNPHVQTTSEIGMQFPLQNQGSGENGANMVPVTTQANKMPATANVEANAQATVNPNIDMSQHIPSLPTPNTVVNASSSAGEPHIGIGDINNTFDITAAMNEQVKNMPDNIRQQIINNANVASKQARSTLASQGMAGQDLDFAEAKVRDLKIFNNNVNYAIGEIMKSGHNIDSKTMSQFSRSIKEEAYSRIMNDIQTYTGTDFTIDIDNVL